MTRFNQLLAGGLTLQIVIAGAIYMGNRPPAADHVQMALLNTEQHNIDHITIAESDGKQTELKKVNGQWQLPDYFDLPADQQKVDNILDTLKHTQSGWPVATTESGRERFEVADDKFQKRIVLSDGDKALQTLYLGTSPGFRQLHVRRAGEEDVYSVKLNSYDFPDQSDKWLNTNLLQTNGDIAALSGPDFSFDKHGDQWQLKEGKGEVVTSELDKMTQALGTLHVQAAAEKVPDKANYELTVQAGGDTLTYQFFADGDNHFVRRNDYPEAFKLSTSDYEKLTSHTAAQLVKQSEDKTNSAVVDTRAATDHPGLTTSGSPQEAVHNDHS